jgi:hypothetical protein
VPANILRDRPGDVLEPAELARIHHAYRCRVMIGPTYRADMWAALEADPTLSAADLARKSYGSFATAWQVHKDGVKAVRSQKDIDDSEARFDGLVSQMPGVLLGVKTADCVPVLIGDAKTRSFAAIHAGWRGTVQSIVVRGVEAMQREFGSEPADMTAAIGPAACAKNYEIGQDVIDAFHTAFEGAGKYFKPTSEGHAKIDLHLANKDQLLNCGIPADRIFTAPLCTMERDDLFFSYRREKKLYGKTGRLMSVIGLRG